MSKIYFILDRSGSMQTCVDDTIGGYNTFVNSQKKENPTSTMNLYLFDNEYNTVYENKIMNDVPLLDENTFIPRGSTSLLDAIGKTIKTAEHIDGTKIVVILTDGHENTSNTYTKEHIEDLIKMKESIGWNFIFLAANQDAIESANNIGISPGGAMTFNKEGMQNAFDGLSAAISRQATGEDDRIQFTGFERAASQVHN